MKKPRYINREADGTTYWLTAGGWMAAPTQTDGTPDLNCVSYVVDFEEYASPEGYASLVTRLLREPQCQQPPTKKPREEVCYE